MRRSKSGDCFEVCEAYGRCFDMAQQTGETSLESALLENIMDEADKRQRKCDTERCAIRDAARNLSERHQALGTRLADVALQYYLELLDKSQPAPVGQEYTAVGN